MGLLVRRIVYTAIICGAMLLALSRALTFLERRGVIDLETDDSSIVFLPNDPYVREGNEYITNPAVQRSMVQTRFRAVKRDVWRMFVLGESFAMGTPYVLQKQNPPGEGGIATWLTADLQALAPSTPIEIINAAVGGQNSYRVREIAEAVVQLKPDAILVATCNNEGVLPPGRMQEILHASSVYRLLAKLSVRELDVNERSYFTPQDPDDEAIRREFAANLRAIIAAARAKNIAVLLCTMPVNLRFDGEYGGHVTENVPCFPAPERNECSAQARERYAGGDPSAAIEILRACEADLEGLRTFGLALYATRQFDQARAVLNTYTELAPHNRCRPSLNRIIREQASTPGVHLVDLEAAAESLSPGGIPGKELFLDYCHMNWAGYAAMADVVRTVMQESGITPPVEDPQQLPSHVELAKRFGLPEDPTERPIRTNR